MIKVYVKILTITAAMQLVGFFLTYIVDSILQHSTQSTIAPIFIWGISIIASMVFAIFFSVRWCDTKRDILLMQLLLPTNYTWLIILVFANFVIEKIIRLIENIPANFG